MRRTPLDDVELRIRLVPGVLFIGVERTDEGPVVFTVVVDAQELAKAEEEVGLLTEALEDIELRLIPLTMSVSVAEMIERTLVDQIGAVACRVDADPETGIHAVKVTVGTIADVGRTNDLVGAVLGEEFVRTRLEVELDLPLIPEGAIGHRHPPREQP